jgi:glyoxylase-like metal-dependent hydrolase (beta-lactamase superfamily II)/rhodanese-related sulfurtransferase
MSLIEPAGLLAMLSAGEEVAVLDVRTDEEFESWSISGAINLPLETLAEHLGEIPDGEPVVVVCAHGSRATEAQAVLAEHAIPASVLHGGMAAWGRTYDEVALSIEDVTIVQIRRRGKGCLSYVVGTAGQCVVIDPSTDLEQVTAAAHSRGWQITHVADTHLHADHVSGARLLAEATGATLIVSDADAYAFDVPPLPAEGRIPLGPERTLGVEVVPTPGHTTGSIMLVLDTLALFTGDTLFVESVGRPDLAEHAREFAEVLYRSLHDKVLEHADEILVLPAHFGAQLRVEPGELVGATLGQLRAELAALSLSEEDFIEWASGSIAQRPPNYERIVRANQGVAALSTEEIATLELGPNRCAVPTALS